MKTKELLIKAAIEVLNHDPSTNLDVIASKANVSRRTLHRYFSSRDEMITACGESIMRDILSDVKRALDNNEAPIAQLRHMFDDDIAKGQHFEFCQKFSEHFSDDEIQTAFKEMGELFNGLLDELKATGVISAQLSNEWLSYLWMGIVRSANQALSGGAIAPNQVNQLAWDAFTSGVVLPNIKKN